MSTPSDAVIVWGEVLWDRFIASSPASRSSTGDDAELGGAPANVAWHLGLAGGWPRLVSRVGDDEAGRRALARLGEIVDVSLVQVDPERATGEVEIKLDRGEPRYTLVPGRAWERIALTEAARAALGEAGVVVFGTLAQRDPAGFAGWRHAIELARCLKVCDLNLRPGDREAPHIRAAIDAADIIKLNDRELAMLREWLGWTDPIGELRKRPRIVLVTHGAAGSTVFCGQGAHLASATTPRTIEIPGEVATGAGDNIGCGDAYLAIFVHGLTLGWDIAACGRAASRWAAAVAGTRGATPWFSEEQVEDLLEAA
jgi:fructokinase